MSASRGSHPHSRDRCRRTPCTHALETRVRTEALCGALHAQRHLRAGEIAAATWHSRISAADADTCFRAPPGNLAEQRDRPHCRRVRMNACACVCVHFATRLLRVHC